MIKLIALPLIGFLIGLLIIALGGGGGVFYVGILTAFFNVPPAIAASTSLATIIPTTLMGTFSHWKAGNVNIRFGLTMLVGGVIGAIAGSLCSHLLPQSLYNKLTGILLLIFSVQMVLAYLKEKAGQNRRSGRKKIRKEIVRDAQSHPVRFSRWSHVRTDRLERQQPHHCRAYGAWLRGA
jgi:hypothetical protein